MTRNDGDGDVCHAMSQLFQLTSHTILRTLSLRAPFVQKMSSVIVNPIAALGFEGEASQGNNDFYDTNRPPPASRKMIPSTNQQLPTPSSTSSVYWPNRKINVSNQTKN